MKQLSILLLAGSLLTTTINAQEKPAKKEAEKVEQAAENKNAKNRMADPSKKSQKDPKRLAQLKKQAQKKKTKS